MNRLFTNLSDMSGTSSDQPMNRAAQTSPVFATTHWSVVLAAGQSDSVRATESLEKLCRTYWYPLYGYIRRRGHSEHDAQDLTQGFFALLLQRHGLRGVAPG